VREEMEGGRRGIPILERGEEKEERKEEKMTNGPSLCHITAHCGGSRCSPHPYRDVIKSAV